MANTPNLGLPTIAEAQASAEVPHNEALTIIDAVLQGGAKSRTLTAPPGSPVNGDVYLVAGAATGAWSGKDGQLAIYADGWVFVVVKTGLILYVAAEDKVIVRRVGGTWGTLAIT